LRSVVREADWPAQKIQIAIRPKSLVRPPAPRAQGFLGGTGRWSCLAEDLAVYFFLHDFDFLPWGLSCPSGRLLHALLPALLEPCPWGSCAEGGLGVTAALKRLVSRGGPLRPGERWAGLGRAFAGARAGGRRAGRVRARQGDMVAVQTWGVVRPSWGFVDVPFGQPAATRFRKGSVVPRFGRASRKGRLFGGGAGGDKVDQPPWVRDEVGARQLHVPFPAGSNLVRKSGRRSWCPRRSREGGQGAVESRRRGGVGRG